MEEGLLLPEGYTKFADMVTMEREDHLKRGKFSSLEFPLENHFKAHEGSKEVACTKNAKYSGLLWHINWIDSDKVIGETTAKEHRMGLGERILQLHRIMFDINAGLKRDETDIITDEEDYTTSGLGCGPYCK
ncbi:hypothetical protein Avbf_13359 [Armadillidium vulgare]|nr:hypothetical protein Avbf_13359 [Armadillidium vulgare]